MFVLHFKNQITKKILVENIPSLLNMHGLFLVSTERKTILMLDCSEEVAIDVLSKITANFDLENVKNVNSPYPLVAREVCQGPSLDIQHLNCTQGWPIIMAGPCAVESEEQIHRIAEKISMKGIKVLRGGTFKGRTSPYSFQGIGKQSIRYLSEAAKKYNLLSITELLDIQHLDDVLPYIDIIQIGSRNMHNFFLLKEIGRAGKPVFLKRGFSATYHEFLLAAEYIYSAGNSNIMLCERGIKTFETYTRNTVDINAIPALKKLTHLPVFIDPSHGTGIRDFVIPITLASLVAGADGAMIEVHYDPQHAYSDAKQTIDFQTLDLLMHKLNLLAPVIKKL